MSLGVAPIALRVFASSETVTDRETGIRYPSVSSTPMIVSGTLSVVPESEKGAIGWETVSVSLTFKDFENLNHFVNKIKIFVCL